jgi:hypothetical protein
LRSLCRAISGKSPFLFSEKSLNLSHLQLTQLYWRRGWRWSLGLHGLLVASVLGQAVWFPSWQASSANPRMLVFTQTDATEPQPELIVEMVDERPWMAREAERLVYDPVDVQDPQWKAIVEEPFQQGDQTPADTQVFLQQEIAQRIAATEAKSAAENLNDLNQLSQQLTSVSSEKTVEEMNGTLSRLLGTKERATAPMTEPAGGEFDFTTAQVHDVRKEEKPDGTLRYIAIMLDAAGRTQEVELDEASGESAFRTMQIVKSNPLLERVYRGVVMGMIDKMLQGSK